MTDLSAFPITARWAPAHPDRIQLYSLPTPNGVKASIMLEELGLPYEAHLIDIGRDESHDPAFLSLNPNGKIPAMIDPDGPGGEPIGLFESGAILMYLADKTGRLLPPGPRGRWEALQWVAWQVGGVGPMFGQVGFFVKYAGAAFEDKRPRDRYVGEARRLLGVLDRQLDGRDWMLGDYSVADIATLGWVRGLSVHYGVEDLVGLADFANVAAWLGRGLARPAVRRGLEVPARG